MRIISGKRKGGKLYEVETDDTRSTTDRVKESIFNIIGPYFDGGVCIDFFSGSGSLCIEALSRGIDFAYFFDYGAKQVKVIEKNVEKFKFEEQSLIKQVSFENAINYVNNKIDLVFLDPPYNYGYVDKCLKILNDSGKLNDNCIIVCEVENKEVVNYEGFHLKDERIYGRVKIIVLEWRK